MVVARDGGQGLAELAIKKFDIVIADLNLPRMDGLTVIEFYLKLKEEKIPKIMLTTEITSDLKKEEKELELMHGWKNTQRRCNFKLLRI